MLSWNRRTLTIAGALAAAVVVLPAAYARRSDEVLPTLYVNYAMNCTFTITSDNGSRVSSIVPGTYQVFITTPMVFADVDLTGISDMTACKSFTQFSADRAGRQRVDDAPGRRRGQGARQGDVPAEQHLRRGRQQPAGRRARLVHHRGDRGGGRREQPDPDQQLGQGRRPVGPGRLVLEIEHADVGSAGSAGDPGRHA